MTRPKWTASNVATIFLLLLSPYTRPPIFLRPFAHYSIVFASFYFISTSFKARLYYFDTFVKVYGQKSSVFPRVYHVEWFVPRSSPWTISRSFERRSLRTNECWQQRRELYGSLRGRHVCIARIVSVACREKKKRRRWWKSRLYRICGYHRMQLAWDEIFTGEFTRCFIYVSKREGLPLFSYFRFRRINIYALPLE